MADGTGIEWTDATWNIITGCTVTSPGCTNCYAMKLAATRLAQHPSRYGLTKEVNGNSVWTGKVRFNEQWLHQPLRWTKPRRIFVCAHGDLFHESVPNEWIDRVFAVMALCPQHTFQVLTKRSARMREYFAYNDGFGRWGYIEYWAKKMVRATGDVRLNQAINGKTLAGFGESNLPNVWLGVSVEDQARADQRIPDLLATPAAVRFISAEPLLGPVDLRWIAEPDDEKDGVIDALLGCNWIDGMGQGVEFRPARPGHQDRVMTRKVCSPESDILENRKLNWVIVGGESGPGARPMHPDWPRTLRDQCAAAGVPFLFKQWGSWVPVEYFDGSADNFDYRLTDGSKRVLGQVNRKAGVVTQHQHDFAFVGKGKAGRLLDGVEHNGYPRQ